VQETGKSVSDNYGSSIPKTQIREQLRETSVVFTNVSTQRPTLRTAVISVLTN
jgi:hypothetical protein